MFISSTNLEIMNPRYILGIAIICFAILLLLTNLSIIPFGIVEIMGSFWPLLIIAIGVNILAKGKKNSFLPGTITILVGAVCLIEELNIFPWSFWDIFWPLLLILIGSYFIFGKNTKEPKVRINFNEDCNDNSNFTKDNPDFVAFGSNSDTSNGDVLNINAVFAGTERRILSQNFKGGKVVTMFGGVKLDLREALLAEVNELEIVCLFGGVELYVPNNWKIEAAGNPIFGGFEDKTRFIVYSENTLNKPSVFYVDFNVVFGGIVVRN